MSTAAPSISVFRKVSTALWRWPLMLVAAALAGWLLFAYLAVDPLARWLLPKVGERLLASRLQAERVAFDPLRLKLTVEGLRLARRDGEPLAGFERLVVDLEADGILRWAWHFKEIRLTAPQAHLDIAPDDRLNWGELIAQLGAGQPPSPKDKASMPRVLIDRLSIEDGSIDYVERNRATPFKAALRPVTLTFDGLSTLSSDRGRYLIAASLPEQGGTLRWHGDMALNPPASDGEMELTGLQLGKILQALRSANFPIAGAQGELAARLKYRFEMAAGATASEPRFAQAQIDDFTLEMNGFAADLRAAGATQAQAKADQLKLRVPSLAFSQRDTPQIKFEDAALALDGLTLTRQGVQLFGLGQAQVQGAAFDLAANELKVSEVLLQQGRLHSHRGKDLQLDWQQLARAMTPAPAPSAAADAQAVTGAAQTSASPLRFAVDRVQLAKWQLRHVDAGFTHPMEASADGLDLQLAVDNQSGAITLKEIKGEVTGIRMTSSLSPQPVATLASVAWQDAGVHLGEQAASVGSLVISGLQTQVQRRADGSLNWQAILASPAVGAPTAAPTAAPAGSKPWTATVGRFALQNATVRLEDSASSTPPLVLDLQAGLDLQSVSLDLSRPVPLKARVRIAQGGDIQIEGQVTPESRKAQLQVQVDRLALKPFSPFLNQPTVLKVDDGLLSVRGNLSVEAASPLKTGFSGGFALRQLALSHEDTSESFVTWKEVSSESVTLSLAPDRLHLQSLRIVEPVGQFIIYEDGTMNATRILRKQPPATAPTAQAVPPGAESAASAGPTPPGAPPDFAIAIERVSIEGASVDFADFTLRPQFGTKIDKLSGVVNGLSNDPATVAQVELDGQVDEFGSARVRGTVQPFRATQFTDLRLQFRNLEMSRLTPYSGKFAGRKIESGKLSVDLEYKIKERLLAGENKFVVNKLKLGERVDSPNALRLPLDLAIAILQDSDGVIDLDLPVSGSLDDPQFSYGKIIWRAIGNVLTRIVTAPFRALGSLFGGNAERLQAISFEPGSATLAPQEQEKLRTVAQALAKRPALRVTIVPAFDPASDTPALQEQAMRRAVLAEAGQTLREDEAPGPLDLNNTRIQSAVERMLKQRTGGGATPTQAAAAPKDAARTASAQDARRHADMLPVLRATFPVPAPQLASLATARAGAMRAYLTASTGLDAERLAIGQPMEAAAEGDAVKLKLELGAQAPAGTP